MGRMGDVWRWWGSVRKGTITWSLLAGSLVGYQEGLSQQAATAESASQPRPALTPSSDDAQHPYRQQTDVVYGDVHGVGLLMDIFTPQGKGNGRAIVNVMSGAWHSDRGKIGDHRRAQTFDILCGKGYTLFAVRPGSITRFGAADMLEHLQQGIRWVKRHADAYQIDPHRLGLMGASAGGHLACLAAVTAEARPSTAEQPAIDVEATVDATVAATAVFFPPTDFLDYGGQAIDVRAEAGFGALLRQLTYPQGIGRASDAEIRERITLISPARRVGPQTGPFLLIHGDADPVVPLQQSQRMRDALQQQNIPVELIVKPGGGHPWPTLHEEIKILAEWFDQRLAPTTPQP